MKSDKVKKKLQRDIDRLEEQLKTSLQKKTHDTAEINLGQVTAKIQELKRQLSLIA